MSTLKTLDSAGIAYEARRFVPDLSADAATAAIGLPLAAVFKTLVCETAAGGVVLVCLPVPARLDMKKLEAALDEPVSGMVGRADLLRRTGFTAGAVTPIRHAGGRRFRVVLDDSALTQPTVGVGGGEAGLEILLRSQDLIAVCGATVAAVT
jgi:Cys-tRNA(Pro)/Cys-tRNA(Cys) deacylase